LRLVTRASLDSTSSIAPTCSPQSRRRPLHVLEDTEIAFVLMVACGLGSLRDEDGIAIPADVRLLHYGIGRDAYDAHLMLNCLGLLDVSTPGRHLDGKVQDYHGGEPPALHRLKLLAEGFEQDAVEALRKELEYHLADDRDDAPSCRPCGLRTRVTTRGAPNGL
jgi:hypothetical protein